MKRKKPATILHTEGHELEYPTLEARQEQIFRNSIDYVVTTRPEYVGRRERLQFRTFPEAMLAVIHLRSKAEAESDWSKLPILYIVDRMGGNFNMPYEQFPRYLQIYNELAGTKYVMPATYQPKEQRRGRK